MNTSIKKTNENKYENLSRPKISISEDLISISDPPFAKRIFLVLFCFGLALIASQNNGNDNWIGIFAGLGMALVFIYDSFSLQRIKIDLRSKIIFRTSLNPLENWVNYLRNHPSEIPFKNIEKIYADYTVTFGGATQRYYVYVRTRDPYKLVLGTFNKESEAEDFAAYLRIKIV